MTDTIKHLARVTSFIYWPKTGPCPEPPAENELLEFSTLLKKNRVLYAAIKNFNCAKKSPEFELGDTHFQKLHKSLTDLEQAIGSDNFITFKTYFSYLRITTDLDIIVRDIKSCAEKLQGLGWTAGPVQQGTMDLEKDGHLAIGLHEKISWDTPPIFPSDDLWKNLQKHSLVGHSIQIPNPEIDILSILAHIPFEKLYLDWGEICYLYSLAQHANLDYLVTISKKHNWYRSLSYLMGVMNAAHQAAFGCPSPFRSHFPNKGPAVSELPFECSAFYGAFSLIEIRAWKKFFEISFDPYRMSHYFRGRWQRKKINA